jgi:hypothetical protein
MGDGRQAIEPDQRAGSCLADAWRRWRAAPHGKKGTGTMQQFRPRDHDDDEAPKTLMQRLDRAAAAMNAFLLVIALGLVGLYFTSFIVLHIPSTPMTRVGPDSPVTPFPVAH